MANAKIRAMFNLFLWENSAKNFYRTAMYFLSTLLPTAYQRALPETGK